MFNVQCWSQKKKRKGGWEEIKPRNVGAKKKKRNGGWEGIKPRNVGAEKIRKRKGREEAKESIGAKIKRKRGVRKAMMIFLCQVLTLHYLVLIHNSQFQSWLVTWPPPPTTASRLRKVAECQRWVYLHFSVASVLKSKSVLMVWFFRNLTCQFSCGCPDLGND